jgi:hypothetical protein
MSQPPTHSHYVGPRQFAQLQEAAIRFHGQDGLWADEVRKILLLTDSEYSLAQLCGLKIIVDYELKN